MIGQAIVVGIPAAGLLSMIWYIATRAWNPALIPAPRPLKPHREMSWEERARRENIKDIIFTALLIMALIAAGLVLLVLIALSFMVDFTIAPTTVIAFLLVLILFKLK